MELSLDVSSQMKMQKYFKMKMTLQSLCTYNYQFLSSIYTQTSNKFSSQIVLLTSVTLETTHSVEIFTIASILDMHMTNRKKAVL